ncbi:galactokinase [Nocardioides mesophilus]|uniref:Galactokinase n=1 Tax=Nocardioides mesophilus TaxID=433659 RepID=A0A7G9RDF6_9ACTN|nr:galactokinase [Nocardioides mesophilus]QNN53631.1 galactokinase [Nocardioides mesophilus]
MTAAQQRPDWGWAAPGRVNLMGEHTDYNDGWVLPFAIGQRTRCALRLRDDGRLRLWSAQSDSPGLAVETTTATTPGDVSGWASYVAGVVWAMAEDGIDVPGADIWVDGDVPLGAGLSSSAALEIAVAVALDDTLGLDLGRTRLAALARKAENDYAGAPTGVMDQVASLHGRAGHVLLLDTRTMEIEQVPADLAGAGLTLLVIDTRASHALSDGGGYASVRRDCERAAATLGVRALRDATLADVQTLTEDSLRHRARHIVTENARVHEAVGQLRDADWTGLGRTFDASHASLRDDFRISCEELDVAVEAATGAGALGARMTGGGFGGSAVALVRREDAEPVGEACRRAFADHDWPEPHVFAVEPSPGAGRLER